MNRPSHTQQEQQQQRVGRRECVARSLASAVRALTVGFGNEYVREKVLQKASDFIAARVGVQEDGRSG